MSEPPPGNVWPLQHPFDHWALGDSAVPLECSSTSASATLCKKCHHGATTNRGHVPVEIIDTSWHILTALDPLFFLIPTMSCCNSSEFASALAFKLHQHQRDENAMILMLEFDDFVDPVVPSYMPCSGCRAFRSFLAFRRQGSRFLPALCLTLLPAASNNSSTHPDLRLTPWIPWITSKNTVRLVRLVRLGTFKYLKSSPSGTGPRCQIIQQSYGTCCMNVINIYKII